MILLPDSMAQARRLVLPRYTVTETVVEHTIGSNKVLLPEGAPIPCYYVRPLQYSVPNVGKLDKGRDADTDKTAFHLYPIVVDFEGVPWAEALVYMQSIIDCASTYSSATYFSIADDLAAFRRFIDRSSLDWLSFTSHKLARPTYRYSSELRVAVQSGELAVSTAKRRMSTVIRFYRWLVEEKLLSPAYPLWNSTDVYLNLKDSKGQSYLKKVQTTDLAMRSAKQNDPYQETIEDGGQLTPLTKSQQEWLIKGLLALDNVEMTLIFLAALVTGARMQTILTMRLRHASLAVPDANTVLRVPVGPGTGIDTKNDKRFVLHVPGWLLKSFANYAASPRARARRRKAAGGDDSEQYLFLSSRGSPLYAHRSDTAPYRRGDGLRHAKNGQPVRQFLFERLIPHLRVNFDPTFSLRFHDLRATYGMNLTDQQLELVAQGAISLHQAREFVKVRMAHESASTTDRYLQYRSRLKFVRDVASAYDEHLQQLIHSALNQTIDLSL